jgi:hypothetical protein
LLLLELSFFSGVLFCDDASEVEVEGVEAAEADDSMEAYDGFFEGVDCCGCFEA